MGITHSFNEPYFSGSTQRDKLVPDLFDAALAGRPYMLDLQAGVFRHESVPVLRQQADASQSPSEVSINPEDLWRRSADTWHEGAGQRHLDRPDSSPARFNTSKGVDVWEKWQLTLLNDTDEKRDSANTNLELEVAGSRLYVIDGASIAFTTDITVATPTFTDLTGEPATAPTSITSDGFNVYTAHGADGIFKTDTSSTATASHITGTVGGPIAYVKNRLMAANTNSIHNPTGSGALPGALFTHDNTDFEWVGFAEGTGHIYAAGFSGDKSEIYRTAVKADGTALDVPVVAGELPDGEIVRSIQGYLGFVVIGTDKGVRFAAPDSNGDLVLGALIPTDNAVKAFEPQDRFVWYGLTNFDATSTGLGRLDLSTFTAPLTPAFASDIMATAQGDITSIVTFQDRRVFAISGGGFYAEEVGTLVASGTLDSGIISYKIAEPKVALFVDVVHDATGQHSVALSVDGGTFLSLGTHSSGAHNFGEQSFPVEERGNEFEVRLTLTDSSGGPTVKSMTLRAYPAVVTVNMIYAPLKLHETIQTHVGGEYEMNPEEEIDAIKSLRELRNLVSWQEGDKVHNVIVQDYDWRPHHATRDRSGWNGTCLVALKEIV